MSWESRRDRKYYYRARYVDGRVIKEFVGSGPAAESAARRDSEARDDRRRQRDQVRSQIASLSNLTRQVDRIIERSEILLVASLMIAGYRQHKGQWRKSQMIAHKKSFDRAELIAYLQQCAARDAVGIAGFQSTSTEMYEEMYPPELLVDLSPQDLPQIETEMPKLAGASKKPRVLLRKTPHSVENAKAAPQPANAPPPKSPPPAANPGVPIDPIARLQELVALAKNGDNDAVEAIRQELEAKPAVWRAVGDLAAHAELLLIQIIADGNALVEQSMRREVDRLKAELAEGETPSPLERLTIQRIIACWLHSQYVDRATLAADAAGLKASSWGKRQEAAEKRFQSAIKSLDLVRRLKPRRAKMADAAVADSPRQDKADANLPINGKKKPAKSIKSAVNASENNSGGRNTEPVNRIRDYSRKTKLAVQ